MLNSAALFSLFLTVFMIFPVLSDLNQQEDDAKILKFLLELRMALLEQVDLQTRFLRNPLSSVYRAASNNRG